MGLVVGEEDLGQAIQRSCGGVCLAEGDGAQGVEGGCAGGAVGGAGDASGGAGIGDADDSFWGDGDGDGKVAVGGDGAEWGQGGWVVGVDLEGREGVGTCVDDE